MIFISYRRDDVAWPAGRIYDHLVSEFGADFLFFDINSIALGKNFAHAIDDAVSNCNTFLAIMGRQWVGKNDRTERSRIWAENDFVRLEVSTALRRNVLTIPILIDETPFPNITDLPDDVKELVFLQGHKIRHEKFHNDLTVLIEFLGRQNNRPMRGEFRSTEQKVRQISEPKSAHGTFVFYSTQPGSIALDGPPGEHSPFALSISEALSQGVTEVMALARHVNQAVEMRTRGAQRPHLYGANAHSVNLADTNVSRLAVVIGNSDYAFAPRLANAVNDAHVVAKSLQYLGFEVRTLLNGDYHTLSRFLSEAFSKIDHASRKFNFVFYYAGHGIEVNGKNYLVPVDAEITVARNVRFELIPMESVLNSLSAESVAGALVILDAARNNPFDRSMAR